MRVLLHLTPIHALRLTDNLRDPNLRHYQALPLAMKVIDVIVENTGLLQAVTSTLVARELEPLLAGMDERAGIRPDPVRHAKMVERVLDDLLNAQEQYRHSIEYGDFDDQGKNLHRVLEFKLLKEAEEASGEISLRLSNSMINLYLKSLELDVEDEQAAAEAVVQSQLDRGKFDEAVRSAQAARWRSIEFNKKVEKILKETERSIASHDWREEVPRLLSSALQHIKSRQAVERNILASARSRLDRLPEGDQTLRAVVRIIDITKDCIDRHGELQGELMRANNVFLDAQAKQQFRPRARHFVPHLHDEVLVPIMRMPLATAVDVARDTFPLFLGARPPPLLDLGAFIAGELAPRRRVHAAGSLREDPDLADPLPEDLLFTPAVIQEAEDLLESVDGPTLLSGLLDRARLANAGLPTLHYLALWTVHEFAPDDPESRAMVVEATGTQFHVGTIYGDDFMITPRGDQDD